VRGLEQRLGLKLFVRRKSLAAALRAGQAYLPAVRAAFDQLNEATEKLLQKDRGGHLTVTTTASFAPSGWCRGWRLPAAANPEIDVRISTGTGLDRLLARGTSISASATAAASGRACRRAAGREDDQPSARRRWLKGPNPLKKPPTSSASRCCHIGSFPDDWQVWLTAAGRQGLRRLARRHRSTTRCRLPGGDGRAGVALGRRPAGRARSQGRAGWSCRSTFKMSSDRRLLLRLTRRGDPRRKIKAFRDWLMPLAEQAPT
jgi:LysR family glycine cleavage system transcriptional activator